MENTLCHEVQRRSDKIYTRAHVDDTDEPSKSASIDGVHNESAQSRICPVSRMYKRETHQQKNHLLAVVCSVGEGWQSPEICQRFAERAELGAFSSTPGNALQDHIKMAG